MKKNTVLRVTKASIDLLTFLLI